MITPDRNLFRASFSVLAAWDSGDWERAIKMYFKVPTEVTQAMEDGRKYHDQWEAHIRQHATLPPELGGTKLLQPIADQRLLKKTAKLQPWLELVGIPDCYDAGDQTLYEFKTGGAPSSYYADSKQLGTYTVLLLQHQMPVRRAVVCHYNQRERTSDTALVWMTPALVKEAKEWIETTAAEIKHYLDSNNIYDTIHTLTPNQNS